MAGSLLSRRKRLLQRTYTLTSTHLQRQVRIEVYRPAVPPWRLLSLVVFNDGQDLERMDLRKTLTELYKQKQLPPTLVVGVYANDRMREYGTAGRRSDQGHGELAEAYQRFLTEELVPWLEQRNNIYRGAERRAIAGFSLGGLSALRHGVAAAEAVSHRGGIQCLALVPQQALRPRAAGCQPHRARLRQPGPPRYPQPLLVHGRYGG